MISIAAYSKTNIYPLKTKTVNIRRRHEEKEYAFVAGELQLELVDAEDVYTAVAEGEQVSVVVQDEAGVRFRGTFQREGAAYDPETEEYKITALHVSRAVFDQAKNTKELIGDFRFDCLNSSYMLRPMIVSASDFEFANTDPVDEFRIFPDFLRNNPTYSVRDYWIDLAKHYRGVIAVPNVPIPPYREIIPQLFSHIKLAATLHQGYDNQIASFSEESKAPDYSTVLFPCRVQIYGRFGQYLPAYVFYSADRIDVRVVSSISLPVEHIEWYGVTLAKPGQNIEIPDDSLDLRVPIGLYQDTYSFSMLIATTPLFSLHAEPNRPIEQRGWVLHPSMYCARYFYWCVHPYKEIKVKYSELLPVNPGERIAVHGVNVLISEVEDDLGEESTTITGKVVQ